MTVCETKYVYNDKMKNTKHHTIGKIQKTNIKIEERGKIGVT
jgi:hypothetical protein